MAWNKHLVSIKLMLKVVIDADDADLIIALVVGNKMNAIMCLLCHQHLLFSPHLIIIRSIRLKELGQKT